MGHKLETLNLCGSANQLSRFVSFCCFRSDVNYDFGFPRSKKQDNQGKRIIALHVAACRQVLRVCRVSAACSAVNTHRQRSRSVVQLRWTARRRQAPAAIKESTHDCVMHNSLYKWGLNPGGVYCSHLEACAQEHIFAGGVEGGVLHGSAHTSLQRRPHGDTVLQARRSVVYVLHL